MAKYNVPKALKRVLAWEEWETDNLSQVLPLRMVDFLDVITRYVMGRAAEQCSHTAVSPAGSSGHIAVLDGRDKVGRLKIVPRCHTHRTAPAVQPIALSTCSEPS